MRFVFHNVPGAEAPAEMTFTIPALKAYGGAENLAQTMHNLLPVRGAKVRDALRWADYMQQALDQHARPRSTFGQHNWPVWGRERIADFITKHRDVYKYTHDQTVRLINAGYTPREIADKIKLPKSLQSFSARVATMATCGTTSRRSTSSILAPMTATRPIWTRCRRKNRPSATWS